MRKALRLTVFVAATTAIFLGVGCAGKKKKKDDPAAMEGGCWEKGGCADGCGCAAKEGCGCSTAEGCGGEGCGCGGCGCGDAEPAVTEESIEDVLEREELNEARIAKLKASLREFAQRSRSGGNLQEAREAWKKILILDPSDKQAGDMYRQISIELGERVPVITDVLEGTGQVEMARKEQTQLEIRRLQTRAREHATNREYQEAINLYERMLSILEWYPYQADFSITSDQVRGLIEGARERLKRSQRDSLNKMLRNFQEEEKGRREEALKEEMRQMQVWLRLATEAFDRGEYLLAQANAEKVMTLDPQNMAARELIRIAKETQYVADRTEIRQQFSDQWRSIMENLELSALPHPQILTFPKNWTEITQRQPVTAGDTTADEIDPLTQRIRNTLRQQRLRDINWEAGEITLENAIAYIRSVTGLNFVLSQKVKEEKAEVEIELKVDNVPVDQVLMFITEPHDMTWKIEYGVVMILDKEEALAAPVLRFYDVKDLVAKIQDFPGQDVNLIPSKYQPPEEEEPEDPVSPFEIDQLIEVIQTTVEPESWDAIEGAEIQPKNNVLVIRTIPEVHRKIAKLLADLRKNTGILVSLEVRFLAAEDRFLRDIGVDIRGLGDQTGGTG
ncbi:MAG: hypothetical protein O7E54_09565, partial [Planctomycetota bacterium]|nr:hypothetical protein [Planctomycetota bacterium]